MNKIVPIFLHFLHELADHNGNLTALAAKIIALVKEAFPADYDAVVKQRRDTFKRRQSELESVLAGSPEQREKILRERIAAAEAELEALHPTKES